MREGWEIKKFDELIQSSLIGIVKNNKAQSSEFEFRYLKMNNIKNDNGLKEESFTFVNATNEEVEKYSLKENDFLFNTRNSYELVGKTCLYKSDYKKPTLFNNNILRVTFKDYINPQFIGYAFSTASILAGLEKMKSGTTSVVGIYYKSLKNLQISFPPLSEQKQIVAILDQAFTAIDQAKANIEKNIENAKELFQSKLNEIFSQKDDGWEEKKLMEITTKIGSGATPRGGQASYKESGISLIRSMNVHDGGFRKKKLAFIDDVQAKKLDNVTILENDVLLNITGASVARCCVVDNKFLPARVNQHVSIIRLKEGVMNYKFLHYALTSQSNKKLLLGIGEQGATRQAITKSQIENFKIQYPVNVEEQNELIHSLDNAKLKLLKLEEAYKNKIKNLEELKKSILQKAFAGELTNKMVEV